MEQSTTYGPSGLVNMSTESDPLETWVSEWAVS